VALTADGRFGRGWDLEAHLGVPSALTLDGSVVDRTIEYGVYVSGSAADLRRLVVRDVAYNDPTDPGRGVAARGNDAGARAVLTLSDALIERSTDAGLYIAGGDAAVARLVVRDVAPAPNASSGDGIVATTSASTGAATLELRRAVVSRSTTIGLFAVGPTLAEGLWIKDVAPDPITGWFGRGVNAQAAVDVPAQLTLRDSRIERVGDVGVAVFNGEGLVDNVAALQIAPSVGDGAFGDGMAAFYGTYATTLEIRGAEVREASRAGVAAFASTVVMGDTRLSCNGIDLNGEDGSVPFAFDDQGDNQCGCGVDEPCKVLSTSLQPPGAPSVPEP
jgi:hypothetical protein